MASHSSGISAHRSPIKHMWTIEDRNLLTVIYKFYDTSRMETASIFNHLIQDRLDAEGHSSGLAVPVIEAQINDLKRTSRGRDFQNIQNMSLTEARAQFLTERDRIETSAQSLGIVLKLWLYTLQQQKGSCLKCSQAARRDEWSSNSDSDSDSEPESSITERTCVTDKGSRSNKRRRTSHTIQMKTPASTRLRKGRNRRESTAGTMFTSTSRSSISTDSCLCGSWATGSDTEEEKNLDLNDNDFARTAQIMNLCLYNGTAQRKRRNL